MVQIDTVGQEILNAIEHWAKQFPDALVQVSRSPGSIKLTPQRENTAEMEFILEVEDFFTVCLGPTSMELTLPVERALAFCTAVSRGLCRQTLHFSGKKQVCVESEIALNDEDTIKYTREEGGFGFFSRRTSHVTIHYSPYE